VTSEVEIFQRVTEWFSEHAPWLAPVVTGAVYTMRKAYLFFQGMNRLADQLEGFRHETTERMDYLAEEQRLQREKLDKMVDGPGVDLRVAPVIETVTTMQGQISQIYNHLLNRDDKRERVTDK